MGNPYFSFKQFIVRQDKCAMKVTTDACLFGAWCAMNLKTRNVSLGLDVGAGTGLLSLMVVQKNDVQVHAVEIDKDASLQAKENIAVSPFHHKINVFQTDVGQFTNPGQYDFIISNPPFYENELPSPSATRNLAHHHGLPLKFLFEIIKKHLSPGGEFYLLLPYKRWIEAELLLFAGKLVLNEKCIVSPTPLHLPQRVMLKGSISLTGFKESFIAIKDEDGMYSTEFVSLLKDYYLYL